MGPTQAPSAWKKRQSTSVSIDCASAQPTEPMMNSTMPMKSGSLRPMRSATGPQNSCPMAKPTTKPVMVSSALPCSAASMAGSAGR